MCSEVVQFARVATTCIAISVFKLLIQATEMSVNRTFNRNNSHPFKQIWLKRHTSRKKLRHVPHGQEWSRAGVQQN